MSAYRTAIDQTIRVIETRARYFRNQIVAVVLIVAIVIAWAAFSHSFLVLLGLFFLVPVCGLFFFADNKLLHKWRAELFASWIKRDLDFFAFRSAMRAIPTLPKETLEGMLAALPLINDLQSEQTISTSTRQAVAATALALGRLSSDLLAFKSCLAAITGISILAAILTRQWSPLIGLAAGIVTLRLVHVWMKRRRLAMAQAEVSAGRARADFSESDYTKFRALLE